MLNTFFNAIAFLKVITPGTKILFRYLDNGVVAKEEVATISSIEPYHKGLYSVTFKEPEKIGHYIFGMDQLIKMKKAYDESKSK